MSTGPIVLIHGGWGGGWEWRGVADVLASNGREVHRPSLTGFGERRHLSTPDVGLDMHVEDVMSLIEAERLDEVVLVGQSYAGMVISAVAARVPAVRSLVYVDAFVPDDGDCLFDLVPTPMAAALRELASAGDGWRVPLPFTASDDDPPEVRAYAERANEPTPLRCFTDPVSIPRTTDVPTTYVRCTQIAGPDLMAISASRARARGWRYHELDAPHDAHFFAPRAVAALIVDDIA